MGFDVQIVNEDTRPNRDSHLNNWSRPDAPGQSTCFECLLTTSGRKGRNVSHQRQEFEGWKMLQGAHLVC